MPNSPALRAREILQAFLAVEEARTPGRWMCSQEFHNAGPWIVHTAGGNRPNKIAWLTQRCEADRCVERLNALDAEASHLSRSLAEALLGMAEAVITDAQLASESDRICRCEQCVAFRPILAGFVAGVDSKQQ